jgi:hypothetical protein
MGTRPKEKGLRYREGRGTPDKPGPWIAGCAYFGDGRIIFTDYQSGVARITNAETGETSAIISDLVTPRGVHSLDDGGAVIAEPGAHRFTVVDKQGIIRRRCSAWPRRPWYVAPFDGRWLVVDASAAELLLTDDEALNWRNLPTPFKLREPRSVVPTGRGTYLLCDSWRHQVVEATLRGEAVWRYGRLDYPSAAPGCLTSPEHAFLQADGSVTVCDTKNHRVLNIDCRGTLRHVWAGPGNVGSEPGCLWFPVAAAAGPPGTLLVADAANGRVQLIAGFRTEKTLWGDPPVARCLLQSPRSVEPERAGYLVADSLNNRVVLIKPRDKVEEVLTTASGSPLFWPRFATRIKGSLYVSDSRNGRVLVKNSSGEARNFRLVSGGKHLAISDPHSIRGVGKDLLICDTGRERLLLVSPSGRVLKSWSGRESDWPAMTPLPVSDLHDADFDASGALWLADTGHHRLVCINPDGRPTREITRLRTYVGAGPGAIKSPRSVQAVPPDRLIVCDSGNHRVLLIDYEANVHGMFGEGRGLARAHLSYPRFARLSRGRVLIADFSNNRVLDLPLSGMYPRDYKTCSTS